MPAGTNGAADPQIIRFRLKPETRHSGATAWGQCVWKELFPAVWLTSLKPCIVVPLKRCVIHVSPVEILVSSYRKFDDADELG